MHWSTVSRTVLGMAGVVLVGYLLNRGVYVGSNTMLNTASGLLVYEKRCHYLYLNGVRDIHINASLDEAGYPTHVLPAARKLRPASAPLPRHSSRARIPVGH